MNPAKFKHITPIQIRFKDVDALGHVNHANHLTYFESARIKYFDEVVGEEVNWSKQGIILARVVIDYKAPVFFKNKISVLTRCSKIGSKSFDLSYLLIMNEDEKQKILAEALTVMVCYDYEKGKTIPMPEAWKKKILSFENVS